MDKCVKDNINCNYKEFLFPLSIRLDSKEILSLKLLFSKYAVKDITYTLSEDCFTLLLNSLDMESFQKDISKIKNENISKSFINLFESIINKILSIKSYGLKNNKRVYIDYNKERKVKNRKSKESQRNKFYYASNDNFSSKNNNIPLEFQDKIICGDSYKILKKLPDNCVDLIFTSPPYNFGLEYEANEDANHWKNYFDKLFQIFEQCIRVLKYGGRIAINIQPLFSDYIPSHHIISNFFMSKKMIWKGEILWEKNNYNCKYTAWGSWKSPSSPYLKYTWEFIEIFTKGSLKKDGLKENIDITEDEFKKWVVSKWSIAPERNQKEFDHPAMFPEELATRVIKLFSFQNDIILDPFNGVGTTTLAARKLQRKYLGIDISKKYCEKAENRLFSILL
jgi:DNA modification methylase